MLTTNLGGKHEKIAHYSRVGDAVAGYSIFKSVVCQLNTTMYYYRLMAVAIMLLIANVLPANNVFAKEACTIEEGMIFEDWQSWQKLTHSLIFSKGHSETWVDVYVNELAEETYRNTAGPYLVCAKIVKAAYDDEEGKEFRSLTVMVKMPDGYDPENGDWWYAIYHDVAGIKPVKQGRLYNDCILCHKGASDTDYLFSKDVMVEVDKN